MKTLLLCLFASASLYALDGVYEGTGKDPYEKASYKVTATITKDKNGVYQATWKESENNADSTYSGTGLKQGDTLSFIYQNSADPTDQGVQVYKIKGDKLDGQFVPIGKNLVGFEKLTRSKK
jgi:hypothetical protein